LTAQGANIYIKDLDFRYSDTKPLVLRNFALEISAGEKVAIVGRTGSGKSSLFQVLSGLYPSASGIVQVDGQDLSSIPLYKLRSEIIRSIAQGSSAWGATGSKTLRDFFGLDSSISLTVDPARAQSLTSQEYVLDLLSKFGLGHLDLDAPLVSADPKSKADTSSKKSGDASPSKNRKSSINESDGFSAGERQLICLIHGLLGSGDSMGRTAKVYLFDECTASVDYAADEAVSQFILSLPATVITIMHRLQHLPKFDKVVVISEGQVVEVGKPKELMADSASELYKLYNSDSL
jgi:ATP-binding cassette subfamily C (CFTR/MRP) protein 1